MTSYRRYRTIILSITAVAVVMMVYISFGGYDSIMTRITNQGKEIDQTFYNEHTGEFWINQDTYEDYTEAKNEEDYYRAPDQSLWENEYRYLESIQ